MNPPRPLKTKLFLLLSSLFLSLVLSELVVRSAGVEPPYFPPASRAIALYHEDPNGLIRLTPNWKGYVSGCWTELNEHGYRGSRLPLPMNSTATRIAFVGDSYTMGDGVEFEQSYPKVVEELLRHEFNVEVINCGVSATNTLNQYHTVKDVIEKYSPDMIVLGFNVNDFFVGQKTRFEKYTEQGYTLDVDNDGMVEVAKRAVSPDEEIRDFFFRNSDLYRLARRIAKSQIAKSSETDSTWIGIKEPSDKEYAGTLAAIERIQKHCLASKTRLFVCVLPGLLNMLPTQTSMSDYPYDLLESRLSRDLERMSIQNYVVRKSLSNIDLRTIAVHFPRDRHYNKKGNNLIGKEISDVLKNALAIEMFVEE